MRAAFAALISTIAVGSIAGNLWFLDFFGPSAVAAALPLLSLVIVGSLLVVRRTGGPIGWLLGAAGALLQLVSCIAACAYCEASQATMETMGPLLAVVVWLMLLPAVLGTWPQTRWSRLRLEACTGAAPHVCAAG